MRFSTASLPTIRHADALAVCRQTSELLRERLGLEPSPMLPELERSILDHDVSRGGLRRTRGHGGDLVAVCPFKVLAFIDRRDGLFFWGRERLVPELLAQAVEPPPGFHGIGRS